MTISDGKIAAGGAVIAAVVILICCFLKNTKKCRVRPREHTEETEHNESNLERQQDQDSLNGHIPLPGFGFDSTLPVKFCTIYSLQCRLHIDFFCIELIHFLQEYDKTCKVITEVLPGMDQNLTRDSIIEPPSYNEAVYQQSDSPVRREMMI